MQRIPPRRAVGLVTAFAVIVFLGAYAVATAALAPATEPHHDVDDQAWVRWKLSDLPPREREVLACLEVVGLDVATTATAVGLSATAVRVARHRGLRRLRSTAETSPGSVLPIA